LTIAGILIITISFQNRDSKKLELIIVASAFILFGLIICCIGCRCFLKQTERFEPLQRAIEEESKKYQGRHCQWRLITKKDPPNIYIQRRKQVPKFHVSFIFRLIRFVFFLFLY